MTLASQIESDVGDVFFNTDDFGVTVTYSRGSDSISVTAIVEPSLYPMDQGLGSTKYESRGYLIPAGDLVLNSVVILPQVGDVITEGGTDYIVPKQSEIPRYQYVDENKLIIRVNTTKRGWNP